MPCNGDYLEATRDERLLSQVFRLIDEVKTGIPVNSENFKNGYDNRAYNKYSNEALDNAVAELCSLLKKSPINIARRSLELQMWWRDHVAADKARKENLKSHKEFLRKKKTALDKLTDEEKKILKLKL
jgi:hypothetical protein